MRRIDGSTKNDLQRHKLLELHATRPRVMEAFDRHRHDRNLPMNGQNGGALLEYLGLAVDAALALGIENKNASVAQPKGSGPHRRYQVGIGIDDHGPNPWRQPSHQTRAKNIAGSYREQVAK